MLDGFKVTDELFNNLVINPSVDSIQEFKIQKSMYPPEFGGKASALINVATKSGSNVYHGSLFEFIRDERFDARNFFDDPNLPVPPLDGSGVIQLLMGERLARRFQKLVNHPTLGLVGFLVAWYFLMSCSRRFMRLPSIFSIRE